MTVYDAVPFIASLLSGLYYRVVGCANLRILNTYNNRLNPYSMHLKNTFLKHGLRYSLMASFIYTGSRFNN